MFILIESLDTTNGINNNSRTGVRINKVGWNLLKRMRLRELRTSSEVMSVRNLCLLWETLFRKQTETQKD